jgi:hypothetical protein
VRTLFGSCGFSSPEWKRRLAIRGRRTLSPSDFQPTDRLFRGCSLADLDDHGDLDVASFESRDLSCNWDRFSIASDIRHRPGNRRLLFVVGRHCALQKPRHAVSRSNRHSGIRELCPRRTPLAQLGREYRRCAIQQRPRAKQKQDCEGTTPRMAHQCRAKSEVRDSARHVMIVKSRFFATAVGAIRRAVAKNSCRN